MIIILIFSLNMAFALEDHFETEAKALVTDLKMSLLKNLSDEITKSGPVKAVPYCHMNVKLIAKGAAKERITKFEFGRTSHKIRNEGNSPQPWALEYLKEFAGKTKSSANKTSIIHKLNNGKRIYMEPLYVEAKCLVCHGDNVSEEIHKKIKELYPLDKATGFKLNEFRGFIWVKEK